MVPLPTAEIGSRDTYIWESYNRYQLTPSSQITPNVQWIRGIYGELTNGDDAWVDGVRMNVSL